MKHDTVTDNDHMELYLFCAGNYERDSSEKLVQFDAFIGITKMCLGCIIHMFNA